MKIRSIAFKWHADAPISDILPVLEQQCDMRATSKKHVWSRSIGEHKLEIQFREKISERGRSQFWLRWSHPAGSTDKTGLERWLSSWFFTMSNQFPTTVFWMQVAFDESSFRTLYGFAESTPKIWTKVDKQHRFSVYPYQDYFYFEVKAPDIKKPIHHHRFSQWIDELNSNLLGNERPNDQILFDLETA